MKKKRTDPAAFVINSVVYARNLDEQISRGEFGRRYYQMVMPMWISDCPQDADRRFRSNLPGD
jgi:hypothetical protein